MVRTAGQTSQHGSGGNAGQGAPVVVSLRPIASSAPLAFFSFAVGTVLHCIAARLPGGCLARVLRGPASAEDKTVTLTDPDRDGCVR